MANQTYTIDLEYDPRKADASLAGFRARIISQLTELQTKSANIKLLQGLSDEANKSEQSLKDLRVRADELKRVLGTLGQGDAGLAKLTTELKSTNTEIKTLETAVAKGSKEFNKLTAAGSESAAAIAAAQSKVDALATSFGKAEAGTVAFKSIRTELLAADRDLTKLSATAEKNALRLQEIATASQTANERLKVLRDSAATLEVALKKTTEGQVGYVTLTTNLKNVEKEIKAVEKAAAGQTDKLKALEVELGLSAKDTGKLAAEQLALATALDKAKAAASVQTARGVLGVTGADEARAQIAKLTEAYNVLRTSGTASINELAVAKSNLIRKTQEVNAQQSILNGSVQQLGFAVIAVAGSVAAYTAALSSAISAASRYEQGLASVASITTLNKVQLDELGKSVLRLSGQIGLDAVEAFRALYTIIGSGIPPENGLRVLESSARAAVAGLTSVENAAKIGVQVLNAYQLQVGQLDRVYDILFQTVRDGVISFEELSDKFGLVLPAARTAGVSLEELSAATVVLTRNGLNAPRAIVALEGAIKQIAAPTEQAAEEMARLGIETNGFSNVIQQLAAKNIGPELLRRLIPDVEGQRAVALLTRNVQLYTSAQDEANKASGTTKEAFDKLKDTPEQQYKKFNAEVNALRVSSGEALLKGVLPLLSGINELLASFNALSGPVKGSTTVIAAAAGALAVGAVAAKALTPIIAPLSAALAEMGGAAGVGAAGIGLTTFAVTRLIPALLAAGVPAYQFGKSFRDNDTYVRSFGDALGGTVAFLTQAQSGINSLLFSAVTLNKQGFDAAVTSLRANNANYVEFIGTLGFAGFAIRDLEVRQIALKKALEESQAAVGKAGAAFKDAFSLIAEAVDKPLTDLNNKIERNAAALGAFQKRLATDVTAAKDVFQAQVAVIDQLLTDQTTSIGVQVAKRELTEVDSIKRITGVNIAANAGRLDALKAYSDDALRAYDLNAKAQLALVQKSGGDTRQVELDIRNGRIALINDLATKYNAYIDGAKRAEESLRDKIKSIDTEIRGIRTEQADAANKLTAAVSGEVLAYYDRQSRAEAALQKAQRATGEERKAFLEEAKTLAGTLGTAVTDAYGREVDGARAAAIQTSILNAAGKIRIADLQEEKRVLDASANSFKRIAEENKAASVDLKEELDRLFPEQKVAIEARIDYDKNKLIELTTQLQADVLKQAPLANVKLSVEDANAAYDVWKLSVEKNRPIAEVQGKFDDFIQKYKEVKESLPLVELKPDTKPVDDALENLRGSIKGFADQRLLLQSNVDDIAAKVKSLNDQELTTKQLTIEVNYTYPNGKPAEGTQGATAGANLPGLAAGGLVGASSHSAMRAAAIAQFANGGSVFAPAPRAPTMATLAKFANGGFVGKVPGTGNTDSVFARLREGSFVVNKESSAVFEKILVDSGFAEPASTIFNRSRAGGGDNIFARSRAGGGDNIFNRVRDFSNVSTVDGGVSDGSLEGIIASLNAKAIFDRANDMGRMFDQAYRLQEQSIQKLRAVFPAGYVEPGAEAYSRSLSQPKVNKVREEYSQAASQQNEPRANAATSSAVSLAQGIAIPARGLTTNELEGLFENQAVIAAAKEALDRQAKADSDAKKAEGQQAPPPQKKADGGTLTGHGIIPAMLTPGELVFSPAQVARIGLDRLHAVNDTKDSLRMRAIAYLNNGGFVAPPMPTFSEQWANTIGPRIDRFNAGGAVTNATTSTNNSNNNTVNAPITINAASNVNERQLARMVSTELANMQRRSR